MEKSSDDSCRRHVAPVERHPEIKGRERDIQISRGRWTLPEGARTEVIRVSIQPGDDIAGYDPAQDADL